MLFTFEQIKEDLNFTQQRINLLLSIKEKCIKSNEPLNDVEYKIKEIYENELKKICEKMSKIIVWFMQNGYVEH